MPRSLLPFLLLAFPLFSQNIELFPFPQNGKWGYMDIEGKEVIPPMYDSADAFSEGLGRIGREANKQIFIGFINDKGQEVIPPKFSEATLFTNGISRVRMQRKYTYLNKEGALSDRLFDEIFAPVEGRSRFRAGNRYGYASDAGLIVISALFVEAEDFSEGLALVRKNNKYGYIDKEGTEIIPASFSKAFSFSEGVAAVQTSEGWHMINKDGGVLTTRPYEDMRPLKSGMARVRFNGQTGFLDASGALILPAVNTAIEDFSKGLARIFSVESRIGYMNKKGEFLDGTGAVTNEPVYPFALAAPFDGSYARVSNDNGMGFMNASGRYNASPRVKQIGSFFHGRARVKVGNYYGFFDQEARTKIPITYLQAGEFRTPLAPVLAPIAGGYRAAYINTNGDEVRSWTVYPKPIPADEETLYVINKEVPLFSKSFPQSVVLTRMPYGTRVEKAFQRTATPTAGLGLKGLLYTVSNQGSLGFAFSEALSPFPPPTEGMGILAYFRNRFGIISVNTRMAGKVTDAAFFNGVVLTRDRSQGNVVDTYYVPYMKVSDAFFLLSAALDQPVEAYPEEHSRTFTDTKDSEGKPNSFKLTLKTHTLSVSQESEGLKVEHRHTL